MLTRRKFLRGLALLGLVPFIPNIVKATRVPVKDWRHMPSTVSVNPPIKGELGRFEGVRVIKSDYIIHPDPKPKNGIWVKVGESNFGDIMRPRGKDC